MPLDQFCDQARNLGPLQSTRNCTITEKGRSLGMPLDQLCDPAYDGFWPRATTRRSSVVLGRRINFMEHCRQAKGAHSSSLAKMTRRESYHSSGTLTRLGGTGWCRTYVVERRSTLVRVFCTMGTMNATLRHEDVCFLSMAVEVQSFHKLYQLLEKENIATRALVISPVELTHLH